MSKRFEKQYAGSQGVIADRTYGIVLDHGTTVPADGTAGFAPGCQFYDLDGAAGSQWFINEGTAASCDFNPIAPAVGLVNATAATLTVTKAAHANKIITLNRAAGVAVTLPAATGTGDVYTFVVGTTMSGGSTTITRAGSDTIFGVAVAAADGGDTVVGFEAAGSTVITMDGSTQGGIKGEKIVLIDIASATWQVNKVGTATGSEATPFS